MSSSMCSLRLHFQVVLIYENPNQIFLKSAKNCVCFNEVMFAEIDTDLTVLGTVVTLHCGKPTSKSHGEVYTIVMS